MVVESRTLMALRRQGSLPRRLQRIFRAAVRAPVHTRLRHPRPRIAKADRPRKDRSAMFIL
jgi:hypothetical protein